MIDDAECVAARETISADADGEASPIERERFARHVEQCDDCAAYRHRVTSLARATRVRPVAVDPLFVDEVVQRSRPARLGRGGWLRPALAWCGLLVAAQSISPLVFGDADGAPTHVARHVGASSLALAVGFIYIAWRPHRAFGMLPYVGALMAAMAVGAIFDVVGGDRSPLSETVHLSELVGMVLLWLIAGSPGRDPVARWVRFPRRRRGVAPTTS